MLDNFIIILYNKHMRLCCYPIKGLQTVQGNLLFRREEGSLLYHNFTFRKLGKIIIFPLNYVIHCIFWKMYLFYA